MDKLNDEDDVCDCPECNGQGCYDQWKAVAGHYEGGEVFRLQCDHCEGVGVVGRSKAPNVRAERPQTAALQPE